ncbi:MAG: glycoside hydrolase family 127 protein, partial [Pirellulaceae bacterium]
GYAGAYRLTNLRAYNETCAAIALAMWSHRMFLLHGHAKYIDVMERIIYNGFLAGVSLKGDRFFYPNPLECNLHFPFNHGSFERSPWFQVSCCPSNVARFMPSIPGYAYAVRDNDVYVNLFLAGTAKLPLGDGNLEVRQTTEYPFDESIQLTVLSPPDRQFALRLRIPGWVRGQPLPSDLYQYENDSPAKWTVHVNDQPIDTQLVDGYAVIDRQWSAGDRVTLKLPLQVRRVKAHAQIPHNLGRVAVERGPLVYCIEGADHPGPAGGSGRVRNTWLPADTKLVPQNTDDLLGGVTVLKGEAQSLVRSNKKLVTRVRPLTMIPYYAWCHRGANEMTVWIPESAERCVPPPADTLAFSSKKSASYVLRPGLLDGLCDQSPPSSSTDIESPWFTWFNHRGSTEWVQYEFPAATEVSTTAVYWYRDTRLGLDLPESWKLLYRDGETWRPVTTDSEPGIAPDRYNEVQFIPVKTDALRIEVKLRPDATGGILEWQVTGTEDDKGAAEE